MYAHLQDYDDFRGYYMGIGRILSRLAQQIHATFRKPSCKTLTRHLFIYLWKMAKKFFRELKNIAGVDKKGDFKHERIFGMVAKIPIANTFNELVGMGFVDYGDFPPFYAFRGDFSRFSATILTQARKNEEQTAEMARRKSDFELVSGVSSARNYRGR